MRILVTGGTGFIGSHVLSQALAAGHQVIALRRSIDSKPCIPLNVEPMWLKKPLNLINQDDLHNVDAIIHLAATGVSPRTASWQELEEINIKATIYMCELAKISGACLVIAGTYAEYGLSGLRYEKIPPTAPLEPTFPYAASKAAASLLATSYARSEKIKVSYLRIFNAFGEGQYQANLWPSMKKAALQGEDFPMTMGEQVRDFIPVEQVAKSFLIEAEELPKQNQNSVIKNIGSGKPQTVRQFCEYWWNHWQASEKLLIGALPYRVGEVMRYAPEV